MFSEFLLVIVVFLCSFLSFLWFSNGKAGVIIEAKIGEVDGEIVDETGTVFGGHQKISSDGR